MGEQQNPIQKQKFLTLLKNGNPHHVKKQRDTNFVDKRLFLLGRHIEMVLLLEEYNGRPLRVDPIQLI